MIDTDVTDAIDSLHKASCSSCTCNTKTPDIRYHDESCRYKVLHNAIELLYSVKDNK